MNTYYAKYTVVLKSLMESEAAKQALEKALSTYPLFHTEKTYDLVPTREELNRRLLNHYKYREIGFESAGRFVDELEIAMCEIMPYYNERLKTVVIMADLENPFDNVDVVEKYNETRKENVESTGSGRNTNNSTNIGEKTDTQTTIGRSEDTNSTITTNNNKRYFTDTPQGTISNVETSHLTSFTNDVSNGAQNGTNSNESTSTVNGTSNSENTMETIETNEAEGSTETLGTVEHTYTKKGNQGVNTFAHDITEYRQQIVDIVNEIITDKRIADLFMVLW